MDSALVLLMMSGGPPCTSVRCGAPALDFGDVRIAGCLVEIPLCRKHFRKLRDHPDPITLARSWATNAEENAL